jgi:hypothetical protein
VAPQLPDLRISDLFIAPEADVLLAVNDKRSKQQLPQVTSPSDGWAYLLMPQQTLFLASNIARSRNGAIRPEILNTNFIFSLSQNPPRRICTSASGSLPTLRHSGGLLWSPYRRRWMLAIELAAGSGFAVRVIQSDAALIPRDVVTDAQTTVQDLGNGMHVAQIGMVLCACLTFFTNDKYVARVETRTV